MKRGASLDYAERLLTLLEGANRRSVRDVARRDLLQLVRVLSSSPTRPKRLRKRKRKRDEEVQQQYPGIPILTSLLRSVLARLKLRSWNARLGAAAALGALLQGVGPTILEDTLKLVSKDGQCPLLRPPDVDMNTVLSSGSPLRASLGISLQRAIDQVRERIRRDPERCLREQRLLVLRRCGLSMHGRHNDNAREIAESSDSHTLLTRGDIGLRSPADSFDGSFGGGGGKALSAVLYTAGEKKKERERQGQGAKNRQRKRKEKRKRKSRASEECGTSVRQRAQRRREEIDRQREAVAMGERRRKRALVTSSSSSSSPFSHQLSGGRDTFVRALARALDDLRHGLVDPAWRWRHGAAAVSRRFHRFRPN